MFRKSRTCCFFLLTRNTCPINQAEKIANNFAPRFAAAFDALKVWDLTSDGSLVTGEPRSAKEATNNSDPGEKRCNPLGGVGFFLLGTFKRPMWLIGFSVSEMVYFIYSILFIYLFYLFIHSVY